MEIEVGVTIGFGDRYMVMLKNKTLGQEIIIRIITPTEDDNADFSSAIIFAEELREILGLPKMYK